MQYYFKTLTISELIGIIENDSLDLSPPYQREFIWSLKDQKELIKTIIKGYPLPNIFINVLQNGKMEMVDGQQRSRSIYRYYKNEIKFTKKDSLQNKSLNELINYKLPVVFLEDTKQEEVREFYVLINKKGKFLNNPEVQRSEYQETKFLKLAEKLTSNQHFINLDLFTSTSTMRLNDRDFVQELLGYLIMNFKDIEQKENKEYEGIRDKKLFIDSEIFKNDISQNESETLESIFIEIIDKITLLDNFKRINSTRYRQRNDFYTLFNFIHKHKYLTSEILLYQYRILLELDKIDEEGNQFIRPTNEDCESLMRYALNCVSQSNSKNARKARLDFFENILINTHKDEDENRVLLDVLIYLSTIYNEEKVSLTQKKQYFLLNIDLLTN